MKTFPIVFAKYVQISVSVQTSDEHSGYTTGTDFVVDGGGVLGTGEDELSKATEWASAK